MTRHAILSYVVAIVGLLGLSALYWSAASKATNPLSQLVRRFYSGSPTGQDETLKFHAVFYAGMAMFFAVWFVYQLVDQFRR